MLLRISKTLFLATALTLLMGPIEAAASPCTPLHQFVLETDWFGGVTVPVKIGGRELHLLVDTGGANSMLTSTTVALLDLPKYPLRNVRVTMYGGMQIKEYVRVDELTIGSAPLGSTKFYVAPDNRLPYALAGTLAPDFLSRFDVEFDFVNAHMNLYQPGACPLAAADAVPITPDPNHHLITPVEIDGQTLPAMLDSGASRSDFSLETARKLFGGALEAMRPATTPDTEPGLYTYPFKKLTIGHVSIADPAIVIVPEAIAQRPAGTPRLVLGMGVLRRLHLYISYSRKMLALTPAQ